jgi:hypothetical protein
MAEPIVTCPNCSTSIPLTESLAAPLIKATQLRYERAMADKDRVIADREAGLRAREVALEQARAAVDAEVAKKLAAERARIAQEEAAKARHLAAADLEARAKELAELQAVLRQRDEKLAEAQKQQAALMRRERELADQQREMELTIEKQVQACLGAEREKAKREAEDALKLRVTEKEEQIASMQRQIEELRRKAEQGSQQLQGEAQELALETTLRARFPRDLIAPVPKGEFGGDVLQQVMGPLDQPCGLILWEAKQTKNWSDGWLGKLRDDQRKARADIALIVSSALPKGVHTFDQIDGIWVTDVRCAVPVAIALRQSLIELAAARQAREGQQTKMELVYAYLTGPRFRHRVEAIVEKFTEMQNDLERERRAMLKMWAKREQQIRGVIEATAGMYGDLQGIAGKALEEIDGIALPMIESRSDNDDSPMAA